jgi:hypothetical protein
MSAFKRRGGAIFRTTNRMTFCPKPKGVLSRKFHMTIASLPASPPLGSLAGEQSLDFFAFSITITEQLGNLEAHIM